MAGLVFDCPKPERGWWARSRCGTSRDCIPDDRQPGGTFPEIVCGALAWVTVHPTGWVEIWTPDNKRRVAKITARWNTDIRRGRCGYGPLARDYPGARAEADAFTIDIPGLQDIVKVKDWESKKLRYERYQRFKTAQSTVPEGIRWIPQLLTKLDNAQDMIYTGLVLSSAIMKRLAPRLLPGLGWILLVNDWLNILT